MGIVYYEQDRIFKLDTPRTSYLIGVVDEEGFLGHIYYGKKVSGHELFYPQLGVKTMLYGGRRRTKNLYGVVKRTVPAGQVRQ